jgi:hypothetical protein
VRGLRRKAVIGQLSEVSDLLDESQPSAITRRLLGITARLAITAAQMSDDTGHQSEAFRYLGLALEAAKEAGNPSLGGRVANSMARKHLQSGVDGQGVALEGPAAHPKPLSGLVDGQNDIGHTALPCEAVGSSRGSGLPLSAVERKASPGVIKRESWLRNPRGDKASWREIPGRSLAKLRIRAVCMISLRGHGLHHRGCGMSNLLVR